MKKIILALFIALVTIGGTNAQSLKQTLKKARYQGEVTLGYSVGVGRTPLDRINVHVINGVRFNPYVSLGIGIGFDFYTTNGEVALPLFVNVKGYLPVADKIDLIASMDIGGSFSLSDGFGHASGFMINPALGVSFDLGRKHAINLALGYNSQAWVRPGSNGRFNTDAFSIKAGFVF